PTADGRPVADRCPRHPAHRHPRLPALAARRTLPPPADPDVIMTSQPAAPHEVVVPPLPFRVRPLGVRIAIIAVLAGLGAVCAVVWIGFGPQVRAQFTPFQISTLLVLGGLILASGHAVARSRVDVRADGLTVVNGYRTRELDWRDVTAVRMR